MEEQEYYNLSLPEAARQFDIGEDDLRSLVRRGAVEVRLRDGQWWVRPGRRRGEEPIVHLWHGTSEDRAGIIVEHGFSPETQGISPSYSVVRSIYGRSREVFDILEAIAASLRLPSTSRS